MKLKLLAALTISLFLVACGNLQEEEANKSQETEEAGADYTVEDRLDENFYPPLLSEEGSYQTSNSRGVTLNLNSPINIDVFEEDLLRLSQTQFSPEDHYLQEGQLLEEETVNAWLGRESEDNPQGLNPPANDADDSDERNPNYLSSILEHDFYVRNEEGFELAGISIGLALNSQDYYPAYQFGPTLTQEISRETLIEVGEEMADKISQRMRENDEIPDVPIMIALFEQAPRDDLAGGVYFQLGTSAPGSDQIDSWNELNEDRLVFPLEGEELAEGNAFSNFQAEVQNFFPNLSSVTGRAHYVNDVLYKLDIDIMTQFYSQTEIIAFTQFLNDVANDFLPGNVPIDINVESIEGIQSILFKEAEDEEYTFNVY